MRSLLLLLTSVAIAGSAPDLSDIDVQAIAKVAKEWLHGTPSYISAASTACGLTAEDGCTLEVQVVVSGPEYVTISKIDGRWTVGKWQRELIAFRQCLSALTVKYAKEKAQGVPIDLEQRRKEHAACYPPDGHAGGWRGLWSPNNHWRGP